MRARLVQRRLGFGFALLEDTQERVFISAQACNFRLMSALPGDWLDIASVVDDGRQTPAAIGVTWTGRD